MACQTEIDRMRRFGFDEDDGPDSCRECEFCVMGDEAFWNVGDEPLRNDLVYSWGICGFYERPMLVELDGKGCEQ